MISKMMFSLISKRLFVQDGMNLRLGFQKTHGLKFDFKMAPTGCEASPADLGRLDR